MHPHEINLRRVDSELDTAFDQLAEIYTEAHESSARKTLERLKAMIEQPAYFFLVALQSDRVVGFAILLAFDGSDAALLEYFALAREYRNHGIGSTMLQQIASLDVFASRFLLAEVDSDKKLGPERAERARRKRFYRRVGWKEVDQLDYVMPPVSATLPPPMDLLVHSRELPTWIERERLRRWLECCYVEVYDQPANDPRIHAMMSRLPVQVQLI